MPFKPNPTSKKSAVTKKKVFTSLQNTLSPAVIKALKDVPANPGVYRFFDKDNNLIYIGKAKNLRNRVRSYFQAGHTGSAWTHKMVPQIVKIEWTIVDSEIEALLLESTLIKENKPKFNIVLKDDKNYNFVRIDQQDDFPRLETSRRRFDDGALYFGPFTDGLKLKNTLELLKKIFRPRTCFNEFHEIQPGKIEVTKKKIPIPCLRYSIGRCFAPCIGKIPKADYIQIITKIIQFFEGHYETLMQDLTDKITELVDKQDFEKAAQVRDQLQAVQRITEQQRMILQQKIDEDIWGLSSVISDQLLVTSKKLVATLLQVRNGKLLDQKNFVLQGIEEPDWERFLSEYYAEASNCPRIILFPSDLPTDGLLAEFLQQKCKLKIEIKNPQRGEKKKLLDLAHRNAQDFWQRQQIPWDTDDSKIKKDDLKVAKKLAEILDSKEPIRKIEGFDISHLGGTETVASCVRFYNNKPDKQNYRRFVLRTLRKGEIDDFKSMREVLERRLKGLKNNLTERQQNRNFIFLHGFLRTAAVKDPLQWLNRELSHPDNFAQRLPHANQPNLREQIDFIIQNVKITPESTIVTHSLGGILAIKLITENNLKIKRLVLIAPPLQAAKRVDGRITKELQNYSNGKFNFRKIKKLVNEIVVFQDIHDHIVIPEEPEKIAQNLEAKLIKMKAPETHFNADKCLKILTEIQSGIINDQKKDRQEILPDLILIDGGKGQLSAAFKILQEQKLEDQIKIIGLAKKEEEIFLPEKSKPIVLSKHDPILQLLQQVRDEAHRFAITHQKSRRVKSVNQTKLEDIPGIGAQTRKKLVKVFGSTMALKTATREEITVVVGKKIAEKIKREFD